MMEMREREKAALKRFSQMVHSLQDGHPDDLMLVVMWIAQQGMNLNKEEYERVIRLADEFVESFGVSIKEKISLTDRREAYIHKSAQILAMTTMLQLVYKDFPVHIIDKRIRAETPEISEVG